MKKLPVILLVALMLLSLAACGQKAEQDVQTQQGVAAGKTEQDAAAAAAQDTAENEVTTEEGVLEDGTVYTIYYNSELDGTGIRVEFTYPDGSSAEEIYTADKILVSMLYKGADGSVDEMTCYPDGGLAKTLITHPDGSSEEIHYANNGSIDPATGAMMSGTITYQAITSADGQVTVLVENVEVQEDGTWWETQEMEYGTTKTLYGKERKILEEIFENTVEGYTCRTEYYESGTMKKDVWTYTNSKQYRCNEFYENGLTKISEYIGEDGREINYQCNEEGYYTYYYDRDQYGAREFFAGENNELVKYIENDKVYEGDTLTENQINIFKQMQDMAAQVAYNILNGI